jgi:hypothetical protein
MQFILLEHGFEGARLNTGTMSNLQTLAASILVNFAIVRIPTLEQGYRLFFDQIEGGGPDGWRLHFFCRDAEAVRVLHGVGVGACGPGCAVTFDPKQFAIHRFRQLGRTDRLHSSYGWCDWVSGRRRTLSSHSSKLHTDHGDGLLAKTRFCDSI